jgi:SAM-dependent methyltransferase
MMVQQIEYTNKPQVRPEQYFQQAYDTKKRFLSYWYQIDAIRRLNPEKVLEVGIGNKFVSDYLQQRNYDVTTMDIDIALSPHLTASVIALPFGAKTFDLVACYEVLEHLPYELFVQALSDIYRVSSKHVVFSVPDRNHLLSCRVSIPLIGEKEFFISIQRLIRLKKPKIEGEHFWEIGVREFTLNRLINDIEATGYIIFKTYRLFEYPSHRFFILRK